MLQDQIVRAMVIGKGSLFLARMTNLFDGVSFVIEKNPGKIAKATGGIDEQEVRGIIAAAMRAVVESLTTTK